MPVETRVYRNETGFQLELPIIPATLQWHIKDDQLEDAIDGLTVTLYRVTTRGRVLEGQQACFFIDGPDRDKQMSADVLKCATALYQKFEAKPNASQGLQPRPIISGFYK